MEYPFILLAPYTASETVLGILLAILLVIVVVLIFSASHFAWFYRELKYLNSEIDRNKENEREQSRWKRRKRRLWLSLIPFVKYD